LTLTLTYASTGPFGALPTKARRGGTLPWRREHFHLPFATANLNKNTNMKELKP
jgi:hypothetical protein